MRYSIQFLIGCGLLFVLFLPKSIAQSADTISGHITEQVDFLAHLTHKRGPAEGVTFQEMEPVIRVINAIFDEETGIFYRIEKHTTGKYEFRDKHGCFLGASAFHIELVSLDGKRLLLPAFAYPVALSDGLLITVANDLVKYETTVVKYQIEGNTLTALVQATFPHGELDIRYFEEGDIFVVNNHYLGGGDLFEIYDGGLNRLALLEPETGTYDRYATVATREHVIFSFLPIKSENGLQLRLQDPNTGKEKKRWQVARKDLFPKKIYPFQDQFVLYASTKAHSRKLVSFDYEGNLQWELTRPLGYFNRGMGIVSNSTGSKHYAATYQATISCWETAKGQIIWEQDFKNLYPYEIVQSKTEEWIKGGLYISNYAHTQNDSFPIAVVLSQLKVKAATGDPTYDQSVFYLLNAEGKVAKQVPFPGSHRFIKTFLGKKGIEIVGEQINQTITISNRHDNH